MIRDRGAGVVTEPTGALGDRMLRMTLTRSWRRATRVAPVPVLAMTTGAALLLVALAYNAARDDQGFAGPLFWAGLITLFLPLAMLLLGRDAEASDRVWSVLLLALGTYGIKILYSPVSFDFPDELQHWRTLTDIVQTGHLFQFNPILQVSPLYPGLEIVTDALVTTTGLSFAPAALIIVAVARIVVLLGLYLFYQSISGSPHVAGAATLFYAANPNFVYFDGQFGYESLALGLAALVLYLLVRQRTSGRHAALGWLAVGLISSVTVVLTHHFTQVVLVAFLAGWAAVACLVGVGRRSRADLLDATRVGITATMCATAAVAWLLAVAGPVLEYLGPNFALGFLELVQLVSGQGGGRIPFHDGSGRQSAAPEQLVGYASVLLVLLALPFGLRVLWRAYRNEPAVAPLAALAIAYPLTLPLRLTAGGIATAGRLPEFLYLGLAFVVGSALASGWPRRVPGALWLGGLTSFAVVVLLGGVFVGWGPPARLPSGYLISADSRSVEPEGRAAAEWSLQFLGPRRALATDRTNALLMGSFGQQQIVSVSNAREDVSPVFFAPTLGPHERFILTAVGVQFAVIDFRLSQGLPVSGVYYEFQEPDGFQHRTPISEEALRKFDGATDVSRIFDSGNIAVYDLTQVIHAP